MMILEIDKNKKITKHPIIIYLLLNKTKIESL